MSCIHCQVLKPSVYLIYNLPLCIIFKCQVEKKYQPMLSLSSLILLVISAILLQPLPLLSLFFSAILFLNFHLLILVFVLRLFEPTTVIYLAYRRL